jgi:hypothetical protein
MVNRRRREQVGQFTQDAGRSKYRSTDDTENKIQIKIEDKGNFNLPDEKTKLIALGSGDKIKKDLGDVFREAKQMCSLALAILGKPDALANSKVKLAITQCFRTDGTMTDEVCTEVAAVFRAIARGFNAPITIKLSQLSTPHYNQRGGVRWYKRQEDKSALGREALIMQRSSIGIKYYSDIKIDMGYFVKSMNEDPDRAARTLVHEASHRFAGMEDHCYMNDDGTSFSGVAPSKEQCYENADSIAWFAMHLRNLARNCRPIASVYEQLAT